MLVPLVVAVVAVAVAAVAVVAKAQAPRKPLLAQTAPCLSPKGSHPDGHSVHNF